VSVLQGHRHHSGGRHSFSINEIR